MFRSLQNVVPSHLADTNLFDFKGLSKESNTPDIASINPISDGLMSDRIDILSM